MAVWDGHKFEGVVIRCIFANGASHRIKIKAEEYKALHRICTGITPKLILEKLTSSDSELDQLRNETPEEFITWFDKHVRNFRAQADAVVARVREEVAMVRAEGCTNKGKLGQWINKGRETWPDGSPFTQSGLIFCAFDGIDAFEGEWKQDERPTKPNVLRKKIFRAVVVAKMGPPSRRGLKNTQSAESELGPPAPPPAEAPAQPHGAVPQLI